MPVLTDKPSDTDSRNDELNPSQQDYDRRFNDIVAAEKAGNQSGAENNNSASPFNDIQKKEAESAPNSLWQNNVTPAAANPKKLLKGVLKGRGALIGAGGSIGVIGVILAFMGYAGFASLPMALTNNAMSKNDARGSVLEKRLAAKISQKMSGGASTTCDTKLAACRAGKIPKSMLSAMSDRGITAYKGDQAIKVDGNGYVDGDSLPDNYRYTNSKGNEIKVASDDFAKTYKSDPEFRKMFKRAYNMRYRGYTGKYMLKNFFNKFGLSKKGGLAADPDFNESTADKKLETKLKTSADATSESGVKKTFKDRLENSKDRSVEKIKRAGGDVTLTVGAIGCTLVNTPKFVASAYRAVQLAQILILIQDVVLSPGSMQQAGDIDGSKLAAIGNLLTEKVKNSDNDLSQAAVDSPILQSAIGVNTNKTQVSSYAPGLALLTNSVVQTSTSLSASTKKTCNLINSPQAFVVSSGVDAAISVSTAGTGAIVLAALKGIGKAAVTLGAVDAIAKVFSETPIIDMLTDLAYSAAEGVIGNYLDGARGRALGDALGTGILAYFSQAGSAGGAAPLTTSQVKGFSDVMASVDNEYKEEDIATLSPFDVSSQYTFLGSIMSNLSLHSSQGNPILSGASMLGYILKTPFTSLAAATTYAADSGQSTAEANCSYASTFGLEDNVAVNAAGYACVGIPEEYINMSPSEVMQYVQDDIDPETGEIKSDSDTGDVVAECNSGDLESMSGCTVSGDEAKKRAAQSIYQYDLQLENILSGEDDQIGEDSSSTTSTDTVSGDSTSLTKTILDSGKVTDATGQIQEIANGTRTDVDNQLLSIIATLGSSNTFTISSLKRDEALSVGAGQTSLHLQGKAVDLSGAAGVNGVSFGYSDHNSTIQAFLNSVAAVMPENCQIGVPNQSYVNATKPLVKTGCTVFIDTGTGAHIHLGVQ